MTQLATASEPIYKQLTLLELERHEKVIREGLARFVEVGTSVAEIINRKGYLARGYKDPETYFEKEFGFSLRHGQRLMAAAQTTAAIKQITGGDAPKNEAAARVLAPIAKDEKTVKRVAAELKKRKQSFATATAEKIQVVVEKVTGKSKADPKSEAAAPQPTLFVASNPDKVVSAATRDKCPNCHNVPLAYRQAVSDDGRKIWRCDSCNVSVALSIAVAVAAAQCPECRKPIVPDDDFCAYCGAVL